VTTVTTLDPAIPMIPAWVINSFVPSEIVKWAEALDRHCSKLEQSGIDPMSLPVAKEFKPLLLAAENMSKGKAIDRNGAKLEQGIINPTALPVAEMVSESTASTSVTQDDTMVSISSPSTPAEDGTAIDFAPAFDGEATSTLCTCSLWFPHTSCQVRIDRCA